MRRDYEKHCCDLVNKHGSIKLKADVKVTWAEMLARAPSYFRRYMKGQEAFKKLTKEQQQKPFLGCLLLFVVYCFAMFCHVLPYSGHITVHE